MKKFRMSLGLILITILIFQAAGPVNIAHAAIPVQPAPEMLRVEAISDQQPPIGYNEFDKYYADLKSNSQKWPVDPPAPATVFLNYYLLAANKPYKPSSPLELKEAGILANASSDNQVRLKDLRSGTVYYAYSRAYYTYSLDGSTFTSPESAPSNTVKFLTDIKLEAFSHGTNQIRIVWDDVWYSGNRIDYKLYISENDTFANTQPIYIGQEQISDQGPVTVNEADGKLEYIHTTRDPGRVYYVKIAPNISDVELKRSAETETVAVSSYILARISKMSTNEFGTVWKLEWSPVVTGLSYTDIDIKYQIFRGRSTGSSIEEFMAEVDDTVFFLTLTAEEADDYYYRIKASVTRNGQDLYPGIDLKSERIYVRETEAPSYPSAPELVEEFRNAVGTIISYQDELTPTSATLLWRVPRLGSGAVDEGVLYDIWLTDDPNAIKDPPDSALIGASVKIGPANRVMSGSQLVGYKYKIDNLNPNSTYYFKIVAKKSYIEYVDDVLTSTIYYSLPSVKVIITPASGPIDQPVAPGRPPVRIKKDRDGKEMITGTSVVIQLQNKWYEQYVTLSDGRGKWVYRTPDQIKEIDASRDDIPDGLLDRLENDTLSTTGEALEFRKVEYDSGVTFDVGCIPYTKNMDYKQLANLPADKLTGVPSAANDPLEDPNADGAIPDGQKHNVDIEITGLDPNVTYVIWVRAVRRSENLISGPSDPIIATTNPDLELPLEKPAVPVFNYYEAKDTYVYLGWTVKAGYNYNLKYGTKDDLNSAGNNIRITAEELQFGSYYKVEGLTQNTAYFFWIQAEASNLQGEISLSDWSDSVMLKTAPFAPPATPKGFGVKNGEGYITKDSITYEWLKEEGLAYILEIADNMSYDRSKEYSAGNVGEYTVTNLRSNFRYYARLYAYDPAKDMRSEPTQTIIVRTKRSEDDYDSDQDTEDVISGEILVKDSYTINNVWNVAITSANAERLVYKMQNDKGLDYVVDLTDEPVGTRTISLSVSARVFKSLPSVGENLIVKTDNNSLVFRPGVINAEGIVYSDERSGDTLFIINITLNSTTDGTDTANLTFKTPVSQVEIFKAQRGTKTVVDKLDKPLMVVYEYTDLRWYSEGLTCGYTAESSKGKWEKQKTSARFDPDYNKGYLSFEVNYPGKIAVAEQGKSYYDDISGHWARKSIENVASAHKINAVAGRRFEPDKYATNEFAVKIMLDMLDYGYGSDYMTTAVKAGLLAPADSKKPGDSITREKAVAMAVRIYELKSYEKAEASGDDTGVFSDASQISKELLPKIKFAVENGIVISRFNDLFGPKDPVTRGEIAVLLEKLLKFAGEL
jgi:hypothetical protein